MCAVRSVMPGVTLSRSALAGALFGVASFFTQTTGVIAAVALLLFLVWEGLSSGKSWRNILGYQLALILAFGVTLGTLGAYFIAQSGLKLLWYCLGTYPYQFVDYGNHRLLARISHLAGWAGLLGPAQYLFVYFVLLVSYPAALWHCLRKPRRPVLRETAQLVLVSLVGLFLLLEIITRVSRLRLYSVSMPAIILLIWAVAHLGRLRHCLTIATWVVVACLAVQQTRSKYRLNPEVLELRAGKTALSAERYEQFSWRMHHTKPGDYLFQISWPNVYFPLDLRSPTFVDWLWINEVTRPEWADLTVRQLEDKQVKYVLCSPWLSWPVDPTHPWQDHLGPFRDYLRSHYTRVHVFLDQDEAWERN